MTGATSRRKGNRGEQDLARWLGCSTVRNDQGGGGTATHDITYLDWAIECKYVVTPSIDKWWEQTARQAAQAGRRPLLVWRHPGAPADPARWTAYQAATGGQGSHALVPVDDRHGARRVADAAEVVDRPLLWHGYQVMPLHRALGRTSQQETR